MHYGQAVYSANFQDSAVHFISHQHLRNTVVKPEWENDYVLYAIIWIIGRIGYGKNQPGRYVGTDKAHDSGKKCFDRIAGTYFDEEGYVDGTFNRHYQRLVLKDQQKISLSGTKNREDIKGLSGDLKEMEVSATMIKIGNC